MYIYFHSQKGSVFHKILVQFFSYSCKSSNETVETGERGEENHPYSYLIHYSGCHFFVCMFSLLGCFRFLT